MYPEESIRNHRLNTEKYDWVREQREAVMKSAEDWANKSDDELWSMIPSQELPRTIDVTWDYNYPDKARLGCLKCGDAIHNHGNYPYNPEFDKQPWKLTCPECGIIFPTNDFGKYYASGINEQGLFDPKKADRSLLFNTDHPDPNDPLHKYGVDDGYGYIDANGRAHKFIGYYAWKYWRHIYSGVQKLSDAYLYTGDKVYARKAAIMLDRIADVYPAMDWNPYAKLGWYHSDGSSKKGKIEGRIWETGTMQQFARSYDKIISGTVDNPELYAFLKKKATDYKLPGDKGTRQDLIANIDKNLLETIAEALISKRISGNEGMHQSSMACAALALNTEPKTTEWLDWIYDEKGGHIPKLMLQLFDRDGMSDEAAPGYCFLWPGKLVEIMNILEPYQAYRKNVISRDFPYFKNSLMAPWRVQLLETFVPNIGDTGATGRVALGINAAIIAAAYRFYDDPKAARFAMDAIESARRQSLVIDTKTTTLVAGQDAAMPLTPLLINLGSEDPESGWKALQGAARNYHVTPHYGEHMAGYGLASFEFGHQADGKALWMYYGRNSGHGHEDRLNFGIYAFKTDLTPDLGYPEFANYIWPQGPAWNNNTISHNTVIVDQKIQKTNWTGYPNFYTVSPGFGAVEVDSPNVYPGIEQYQRTMAFIGAPGDNAYAVDFFRVKGGSDHLLGFHGPPGTVTPAGISFTKQTTGTYAGENVPFESMDKGHPYGYSFLKNVERAEKPATPFTLDWKAEAGYRGLKPEDNVHMKMHFLTSELDDVALADGIPPQNKPGNPKALRYALMHRKADGDARLVSFFASVLEPWKDKPFIKNATLIPNPDSQNQDLQVIKVEHIDGTLDYIISNPDRRPVRADLSVATDGAFAWVRLVNGRVTSASLTRGTNLIVGDTAIKGAGNVSGELVRFEKDPKKAAIAWVKIVEGDAKAMAGQQIIFDNDKVRNACYDVKSVEQDGEFWKLECGPGNFVRGFIDENDYSKGHVYNIKEGAKFYAPVTTLYHGN